MLLELKNISKHYEAADGILPVLNNISFSVEAGDSVAIRGPSGSGKSTLLNIIGALDQPSSGTVELDDRDLSALDDKTISQVRNQDIGFVFQLHHLLPQCTVLENVLIPVLATGKNTGVATDKANALLDRVGLSERKNAMPARLSGGERQRAAVARALINSPRLVLADEPTGSLDNKSAVQLGQLLVDLNKEQGTTLIVVTHSVKLAGRMDKQYELHDGELRGQ